MLGHSSSLYCGGHAAGQLWPLEVGFQPMPDDEACTLSTLWSVYSHSYNPGMWRESLLKLPISPGPADWVGFALLGRGGGKMRGLAQDFYWKTLKTSATRSAVPPGAGILGFVLGRGWQWSSLSHLGTEQTTKGAAPFLLALRNHTCVACCPCLLLSTWVVGPAGTHF